MTRGLGMDNEDTIKDWFFSSRQKNKGIAIDPII